MKSDDVWIFAYGSLCWRPGFEHEEMVLGHIKGFVRRFWQGNTVHRGTVDKPGRVATLVSDAYGETHGCAFKVPESKAKKTLKYLENRETVLGGYDSKVTTFYPCDSNLMKPVKVILYIALPGNVDWRGPAHLHHIADEVLNATGVCGTNLAYVTDLAEFLRTNNFKDDHLFELEFIILKKLKGFEAEEVEESTSSSSSGFLKTLKLKAHIEDSSSSESSSSSSSEFDTDSV